VRTRSPRSSRPPTRRTAWQVILENAYLSDEQIVEGSRLGERAGAEFIKTSTGLPRRCDGSRPAAHGRGHVSESTDQAAGGVRTLDRLLEFVAIGVTRFGATATAAILDEATQRSADGAALPVPATYHDEGAADAATTELTDLKRSEPVGR